jgi:uncharacterized membrane-anchored protein
VTPPATHSLLAAVAAVAEAAGGRVVSVDELMPGDVELTSDGEIVGGYRPATLHGAVDRLVSNAERTLGVPVEQMTREQKQELVQRLERQGAFTVRHGVEDVADRLGVSRFTIYNYLNAVTRK